MNYRLFFKRVSPARKDLQDNKKWPSSCMPDNFSNRLKWTILRSGPGWLLILEQCEPGYDYRLSLRDMYKT